MSTAQRLMTAAETEVLIEERTGSVDQLVRDAFRASFGADFPTGVAALAVGGFGRRELFPHSDVDVLLLTREGIEASALKPPVGLFVQKLWDLNLRLSHSVRTVADCCQLHDGNAELSISLIDRRFLAGDESLFEQLESKIPKFFRLHGRTLARQLAKLSRGRHSKFQNTIYHLEPNLKETPGGLRDLHVIHWLTKLAETGSVPDLAAARAFLFPLRAYLHLRTRRDDNVLSFDAQEEISGQPAEMMRSYYRHAREIGRAARDLIEHCEDSERSLLGQFRDWRARLSNNDVTVARDRIFVRFPQRLGQDASYLLRVFEFAGRHGIAPATDTERRVIEALPVLKSDGVQLWPSLREILQQPKASFGLRAMEESGVLTTVIPEWRRIECLVVRDFYHRYTVDEHTIVAVESLEHIDDARFQELMSEIDRPWILRLALLLHDIGKGTGNHVAVGLDLAHVILSRLHVPAEEVETVLYLISQHLALSSVMTSRDLDDLSTARTLASQVGTVERLKLLTLLTYADISAVNPTAMTPWRREQLWRTYLLAHQELTRELETERIHGPEVAVAGMDAFLEGLPKRYLRTHAQAEVERHFALWTEAQTSGIAVDIERMNGFYRLVVATPDRPFLFASISGALASFGMNILKAEASANAARFIFDTFTFADPLRTLELNPSEFDRLRDTIVRVVLGKQDVRKLLQYRPRATKRPQKIRPSATFNNDASPAATLIEIVAEDRPGLLYDLSSAMSKAGCNIEVVLIDTEAQKALDVFYVTAGGAKLPRDRQAPLQASLLRVCSA